MPHLSQAMELTSSRPSSDAPTVSTPAVSTATRSTGGGQCSNCGAHLAPDQRYCVECGRRTSEARPTLMREPGALAAQSAAAAGAAGAPTTVVTRGASQQSVLVIGVGVLLLAVGVGVLIGHSGNNNSPSTPITRTLCCEAPRVTTVVGAPAPPVLRVAVETAGVDTVGASDEGREEVNSIAWLR
jgi:hypothetical protein